MRYVPSGRDKGIYIISQRYFGVGDKVTNFDFLKSEPQFATFCDVAASSEQLLHIDISAAVLNCRRAMEFAVKWMYSVDKDLEMPYDNTLMAMMSEEKFRDVVGEDIYRRMDFIRKTGNIAAHGGNEISMEQAEHCVENLFYFLDYVAYCYGKNYVQKDFDKKLLELTTEEALAFVTEKTVDVESLMAENKELKEELTARRAEHQQTYVPKPLELSEFDTRRIYIDTMLQEAGWTKGENWIKDVPLPGTSGFADYVLYDDAHSPLAVIEARHTCKDFAVGRQWAKLYADILEKQFGRRPVVYLTNGFEIRMDDGHYPERNVAAFYSKRNLEKLFDLSLS